jgi:hypothetical protein
MEQAYDKVEEKSETCNETTTLMMEFDDGIIAD